MNTCMEKWDNGYEFSEREDTCMFEFWYPRADKPIKQLEVGLMDVRAADSIRIHYDFDRDGWVVEQAALFEFPSDEREHDEDWQEVAFIKAWARERPNPAVWD